MPNAENKQMLIDAGIEEKFIDPPAGLILPHKDDEGKPVMWYTSDYPYGFRLRSTMRYWLETAIKGAKKGETRLVTQANNPKYSSLVWNTPSNETYNPGYNYLETILEDGIVKIVSNAIIFSKYYVHYNNGPHSFYDTEAFEHDCEALQTRREECGLPRCEDLDIFKKAGIVLMNAINRRKQERKEAA